MLNFIPLKTKSHSNRSVSISYDDDDLEASCFLLGNLEHNTEFSREDLVDFAKYIFDEISIKPYVVRAMKSYTKKYWCSVCKHYCTVACCDHWDENEERIQIYFHKRIKK